MELAMIQKKLHKVECPSCQKKGTLDVTLNFTADKETRLKFRCAHCDVGFLYAAVAEEIEASLDDNTEIECDAVSMTCMPRYRHTG